MESVLALLDRLEALLARAAAGSAERRGQDGQEAAGLLRMIRAALPAELHHAERLREEAEAQQIRRSADEYATRVLADLEAQVERILAVIQRGRTALTGGR